MADVARTSSGSKQRTGEPERTCIVTRVVAQPSELIRFVVGPEDEIFPDVGHKLPGRGVWVTADMGTVAEAVRTKAFARALRRQVRVAEDLPSQIDVLLQRRLAEALSLTNKAGLVTPGFTRTEAAILAEEVYVLLHAVDAADDGAKKLDRLFRAIARDSGRTARIVRLLDVTQMSLAIGRANVVHAAVKPGGAARRFLEEARRLVHYRRLPADEIEEVSPQADGSDGAST